MSDTIEVVRYARPNPHTEFNDNLYGITFVFTLNYVTRKVNVQWSVCNGDNFDKKVGYSQAKKRTTFEFDLDLVKNRGLVKAFLLDAFQSESVAEMMVDNYPLMHHMFCVMTRHVSEMEKNNA